MDRRALKHAARQDVTSASYSPRRVTLVFLLLILALAALEVAANFLAQSRSSGGGYLSEAVSAGGRTYLMLLIFSLLCQCLATILTAGYTAFALKLNEQAVFSLRILWEGFYRAAPVLLLYLMKSMLLALWTSILSVPLLYLLSALLLSGAFSEADMYWILLGGMSLLMFLLSYRYRMAVFMLMDDPGLSARQAINQAKAVNKIHRFRLFVLDVSFLPWIILCIATCGILFIWKLPYMVATYGRAYRFMLEDYARRQANFQDFLSRMGQRPRE